MVGVCLVKRWEKISISLVKYIWYMCRISGKKNVVARFSTHGYFVESKVY